jgi:ArsR family transcriptional regulator, arsenate/arsenite/antimonite-responsive transcriptional repressor
LLPNIRIGEYTVPWYICQHEYMTTSTTKDRAAIDRLESVFRALGDKTRLRILGLLGKNEVCVCHIHDTLGLPQPTVSRHLAYLRRTGLVDVRRDGVWMHYRISQSLDPLVQNVVQPAVDALTHVPTTSRDRKQFQRSFGQLYVVESPAGGTCCAPRAQEPQT